jgi:hypothetical protein
MLFWGVRVSRLGFFVPAHNLLLDSKSKTSRDLSYTSQLVVRQLEVVMSLQVIDIQVATGRQVERQIVNYRATRNSCHQLHLIVKITFVFVSYSSQIIYCVLLLHVSDQPWKVPLHAADRNTDFLHLEQRRG